MEATVEGEATSRREAPRHIQNLHPASKMIGDINERTTRSRSQKISRFAHSAFVATFEPKDIGHALLTRTGSMPCMRSLKTLRETRCGN